MNLPLRWSIFMLLLIPFTFIYSQDAPWVKTFEEREELRQILKLSDGNYLLSGKTFEIGNKSDLVILVSPNGEELGRKAICEQCNFGDIVYSKETKNNEIMHIRSSGDVFVSSLDLEDTRFVRNLMGTDFESIETYQVLENNSWIVVVSSAVKEGIRGLLHTTVNTTTEEIGSQKFNNLFPDISGSIGIGLYEDAGVIDGYNEIMGDTSIAHLLRYDRPRNLVWEKVLDEGNVTLLDVTVSYDQNVYAVGTIDANNNSDQRQGFVMSFDRDGELIWEKRFDSAYKDDAEYTDAVLTVSNIKQLKGDLFVITGNDGGTIAGKEKSEAFIIQLDDEGNEIEDFSSRFISEYVEAVDAVETDDGEVLYLANAFAENGIAGSYVSIARNLPSSAYEPVPSNMDIFPNPTADFLTIRIHQEAAAEMVVEIFNTVGQLQLTEKTMGRVDLSQLESGVYYLAISKGEQSYLHTFIKE